MREVTRVPPLKNEAGLIAYECSACGYVMGVIVPAGKPPSDDVP
jgi:hypothetical protein